MDLRWATREEPVGERPLRVSRSQVSRIAHVDYFRIAGNHEVAGPTQRKFRRSLGLPTARAGKHGFVANFGRTPGGV